MPSITLSAICIFVAASADSLATIFAASARRIMPPVTPAVSCLSTPARRHAMPLSAAAPAFAAAAMPRCCCIALIAATLAAAIRRCHTPCAARLDADVRAAVVSLPPLYAVSIFERLLRFFTFSADSRHCFAAAITTPARCRAAAAERHAAALSYCRRRCYAGDTRHGSAAASDAASFLRHYVIDCPADTPTLPPSAGLFPRFSPR